ncbi:hypothetical protein F2Q69_00005894 [Brassica cretica]|uniref:Uncharacterized protein n=1 Tax=Brassica cretica TaxID=69181 RepID=A0A8S9P3E7_BRACR|nr:hypothetical protein F2Q69_00005894 [Brassica cretica]
MPSSSRSNKETQLLFSPDPASLEHSIRKEARSSSIDNNACSSLDSRQPPSIQALVPSTDIRSPSSTEDTHLPSTDIFHPTSIDTSIRTSIDTDPRDMVATLILVRDERGDLYDQEGHLRNATGQRIDAQGAAIPETSINNTYGVNRILQCREDHDSRGVRSKTPTSASPVYVKIDRHSDPVIGRHQATAIDRQPPAPIDR